MIVSILAGSLLSQHRCRPCALLCVAPVGATQLLTVFAFNILIANTGNAADLRLQLREAPQHEKSLSATPREQLLKEFLDWLKKREQH